MIRAVLAVATAVALLAVTGLVLADARVDATEQRLATAGKRDDRAAVDGVPDDSRVRQLATRNVNHVTLPYGEVAGGVGGRLLGSAETPTLATAGRALVVADRTLTEADEAEC